MTKLSAIQVSIVIPMLNEELSIIPLLEEIRLTFKGMGKLEFEVIVVNDGSTDSSVQKVKSYLKKHQFVRLVSLRRSFGQTAAMAAGIDRSRGRAIVTLDADGQNDPKDIPQMLHKMSEGFECVSGRRLNRQDKYLSRRAPSLIANWLIRKVTKIEINDFGCTLKAYEGDLLRSIPLYGDMHRLLPFYISLAGGNIAEVDVNHRSRKYGVSKYGLSRTFRVINDLLVAKVQGSFFSRPMHLFGNLGLTLLFFAAIFFSSAVYMKLTGERDFIESPLLLVSGICTLTGLQMIFTGFLAEIILRRFSFASKEQRYVVRDEK